MAYVARLCREFSVSGSWNQRRWLGVGRCTSSPGRARASGSRPPEEARVAVSWEFERDCRGSVKLETRGVDDAYLLFRPLHLHRRTRIGRGRTERQTRRGHHAYPDLSDKPRPPVSAALRPVHAYTLLQTLQSAECMGNRKGLRGG